MRIESIMDETTGIRMMTLKGSLIEGREIVALQQQVQTDIAAGQRKFIINAEQLGWLGNPGIRMLESIKTIIQRAACGQLVLVCSEEHSALLTYAGMSNAFVFANDNTAGIHFLTHGTPIPR